MKVRNISLSRFFYKISLILVFCAPFVFGSCRVHHNTGIEPNGAITLSAMLDESSVGVSAAPLASAVTRAEPLSLAVGTELGLFLVSRGANFAASDNFHNNAKMIVEKSGDDNIIVGDPDHLYYPNRRDEVNIYSYYPYTLDANITDATAFAVGVKVDQSVLADYEASDFCWGTTLANPAPAVLVAVPFSHRFSQLILNIEAPGEAASISAVKVLNVRSKAVINLGDGVVDVDAATVESILAFQTLSDAKVATKKFTVIVPAQDIAINSSFISVTVDGKEYIYSAIADHTFVGGSSYTFNLKVSPSSVPGSLKLSGTPIVGAWSSITAEGSLISRLIDNSFTVLWRLPHAGYATAKSATITVSNPTVPAQEAVVYTVTDFRYNGTNSSADLARFSFKFELDVDDPLSYPYKIDMVSFYSSEVPSETNLIQACPSLIAALVPRNGAYTLGIEQHNLINITKGEVEDWVDLDAPGGDLDFSGPVDENLITLIFCDNKNKKSLDVTSVQLTTGAGISTLSGFTMTDTDNPMTDNPFAAKSNAVDFRTATGATGALPTHYPFFITKVEYFGGDASLGVLMGINIAVRGKGPLTLEIMTDGETLLPPPPSPTPEVEGVLINRLYWAKGNLVADDTGYCKIGKPEDGGLYFQWGKLVGWSGGSGGNGEGVPTTTAPSIEVKPDRYTSGTDWVEAALIKGNYGPADAVTGVGDPCRYYLGGEWRTPTTDELLALFDGVTNNTVWGSVPNWKTTATSWPTTAPYAKYTDPVDKLEKLRFPASGYRANADGSLLGIGVSGYYWSSSVYSNASFGYNLTFNSSSVYPQGQHLTSHGFPVRCVSPGLVPVQPTPPAPTDPKVAVEIGDLYWAKGNLVADGEGYWCKIGEPTDGGLYFRFGSLMGWGAVGSPTLAVKPSGYSGEPSWAYGPYYTAGEAGDIIPRSGNATTAIGDPCRFYLGEHWRLPTSGDFKVLFGDVDAGTVWGSVPNWSWSAPYAKYTGDKLLFPVSGSRNYLDGSLADVGAEGYGWSSSVYNANIGYNLNFNSSVVYPQNNLNRRSSGFPVRCVRPVTPGNVTDWGDVDKDDLIFNSLVTTNPISLIFADNVNKQSMLVTSVRLTTAAGISTLKGFKMKGNVFAAQSTSALDFKDATGAKPIRYPFFITKVEFLNGTVVVGTADNVDIAVRKAGPLTLEIMTDTPPLR